MSQRNNTLWLSLFIIVGLPVLFWLAGWIFVRLYRDPKIDHSHACPHCQRQGQLSFFGAFQCVSCGRVFYVSESGRDLPSLRRALMWPLIWDVVSGSLIIGIDVYLAEPWWASGFYRLHILTQISYSSSRKKFPAERG